MIYFLSLLTSLCIQFCAVTFPINNSEINAFYSNLTDTLYNDIQNRGFLLIKNIVLLLVMLLNIMAAVMKFLFLWKF